MEIKFKKYTLEQFSDDLGAKKTMPGGGSAAGYVASLGTALAMMTGNFTLGKKKYEKYSDDIEQILEKAEKLKYAALELVDRDAEAYLEFSHILKNENKNMDSKQRYEKIQAALKKSAQVPLELLKICRESVLLHEELCTKGSRMLITDVGAGAAFLKSAALASRLNILVNIRDIDDTQYCDWIASETDILIDEITKKCDKIYNDVLYYIR